MAITITGEAIISQFQAVHVYTLSGDFTAPTQDANGYWVNPITWSGDNSFDLRIGEYEWKWRDDSDHTKGYDIVPKTGFNPRKVSLIVDEDLHHDTNHFRIFATCKDKAGVPTEVMFEGQVAMTVPRSVPDYTFKAGVPTGTEPFVRPEFYAIHESDNPAVVTVSTPFYSTYPSNSRDYEHVITYSGDSSFFWDSGQDVSHVKTPDVNGMFTQDLEVHDWAPHADYTGYTTVSAIGSVVHQGEDNGPRTVLAQDGYLIFIEYHTGTAIRIRVLKANEEKLLVTNENKAIETHGNEG